ncbi:MAG TPA: SMC-Scp complex subunit ScpB [Steroidobacteraceae bacterium]|jgi:segregation and condensation protein B
MSETEIRNVLEAALLAAGRSLSLSELSQLFEEGTRPSPTAIRAALDSLAQGYDGRAVEIQETNSGYRVQVRRQYAAAVARLWPERPQRYSRALLETLALIGYRQPITRAEIEAVRGVAVNPNIIRTLLERQWIRVVGHRDLPGRPELLGTTRDFLDYFGLKSLDDLPPLAQLRSLGEIDPQFKLPVGSIDDGVVAELDAVADGDAEAELNAEADQGDADEEASAERRTSGLLAAPRDDTD